MTQRRSLPFDSVIVSVMLSESKVFRCHELPDWQRWLWLVWALLPGLFAWVGRLPHHLAVGVAMVAISICADWVAGWEFILGPLPVGMATG